MSRLLLALVSVCLFGGVADAQIFPNAFWNQTKQVGVSGGCPGGVCPTAMAPQAVQRATTVQQPGHWTYPGTIENHLESTHGVATAGMSRQEKLNLHDSLHEGTETAPQATYPSVQSTTKAFSGGSSGGSFVVGGRDSQGHVITSIGVLQSSTSEAKTFGAIGSRRDFKRSLLEAAKQAQDDGDISAQDYRKLAFALKIPGVAAKMEAAMADHAVESGVAKAGSIDWDKLLAFIKEMIPIILQLIQLFSQNAPDFKVEPYVQLSDPEPSMVYVPSFDWYSAA